MSVAIVAPMFVVPFKSLFTTFVMFKAFMTLCPRVPSIGSMVSNAPTKDDDGLALVNVNAWLYDFVGTKDSAARVHAEENDIACSIVVLTQ